MNCMQGKNVAVSFCVLMGKGGEIYGDPLPIC